jgi:hypothetical protein
MDAYAIGPMPFRVLAYSERQGPARMKPLLLAHILALAILAGLFTASRGAFARSWPRIVAGAGIVGLAMVTGYWVF